MKRNIFIFLQICLLNLFGIDASAQGLPPGWDYSATPSTYIISIPVTSNPNINDYLINPGDYIGVFYTDDNGDLKCGGASEWLGNANTGIIAFGDDGFTTEKDGFSNGEAITYRFYSWSVEKEYDAEVICNDNLPVTCDVFAPGGLAGVDSIWATGFYLVISANPDSVCMGSETQLLAEPSGGSGNYTYSWSSDPAGFGSDVSNPTDIPMDNTTYYSTVQDGDESLQTSIFVEVFPEPEANTGPDLTICEDSTVVVSAEQNNSTSFFWNTAGDGTFNNINIISPEYTPGPGDIDNGGVQLTFTAEAIEPCVVPASSDMNITIIGLPLINVGEDQSLCENDAVLASASLLNAVEIFWNTTGDGTFSNPSLLDVEYFPGSEDISNAEVELFATAAALAPCQIGSSDSLVVTFGYLPSVNAGDNIVVCQGDEISLFADATNVTSVLWSTGGDGTFADASNPETDYFPGTFDIQNGEVELSITGNAIEPCLQADSDNLMVTIIKTPVVDAGSNETICETANIQLSANALNFEEVLWNTDGDGTFEDSNSLNTLYYPGELDIQNQSAVLTIVAQPLFPCLLQQQDEMLLTITLSPLAIAGEDFTIHYTDTYQAQGEAMNYSTILWGSDGDGTFDNPDILDPIYTPGEQDINNAGASLTLTANPISPCNVSETDDLFLEIDTTVNIQIPGAQHKLIAYPNPATDKIFIEFPGPVYDFLQVNIYNVFGNVVKQVLPNRDVFLAQKSLEVDLSEYESGIYILQVLSETESYSQRIILKRH